MGGPGGQGGWRGTRADNGGAPGAQGGRGGGVRPSVVFLPGPDGKPKAQPIRTGINDGQWVEVVEGLDDGAQVITGIAIPGAGTAGPRPGASPSTTNPFSPQFQRRTRG